MPLTHDQTREDRIIYEVIVDCYEEHEELMGWYYYMADNLEFPIKATVRLRLRGGAAEVKKVDIVEVDKKSEEENPIRFGIVEDGGQRVTTISPEEIVGIGTSAENTEIINDWLYWHNFGLLS
jgi:Calcium binding